jgi:hypothetical protein
MARVHFTAGPRGGFVHGEVILLRGLGGCWKTVSAAFFERMLGAKPLLHSSRGAAGQ